MKMVICFDTEDEAGMRNAIKMVDHMAKEYLNQSIVSASNKTFGKIEFIKILRLFAERIAKEEGGSEVHPDGTRVRKDYEGLKYCKVFTDHLWQYKTLGKSDGSKWRFSASDFNHNYPGAQGKL